MAAGLHVRAVGDHLPAVESFHMMAASLRGHRIVVVVDCPL